MDLSKSIAIQRQIMENSKNLNKYYEEFDDWISEMNKKDKIVSQIKSTETQNSKKTDKKLESTINSKEDIKNKEKKVNDDKFKKYKRDGNSIKDYYDNWDKVDFDEDLVDVDSKVIMNTNSNLTPQQLYDANKKSSLGQNLQIKIQNNRNTFAFGINNQIEKLKKEADGYFFIKNYNRSFELYSHAISLLKEDNIDKYGINLYNNRGNCQIKLQNYKMGIPDFEKVLSIDKNNIKALFRRGICYKGLEKYNLAFEDFSTAYNLSIIEEEKEMVKNELNKVIDYINQYIVKERKKAQNFIYKENLKYNKIKIYDFPNIDCIKDSYIFNGIPENKTNVESKSKEEINNKEKENQETIKKTVKEKEKVKIVNKDVIKKEEINKFIYEVVENKISASAFKYAFRNLGDDINAKKEYLIKINPTLLPVIFKTDLDKDTLIDIIKCLNLFEHHNQIIDYLKAIIKISRIKLILQLIPKKNKQIINDLFNMLENGPCCKEVIPIKDFFFN